MCNICPMIEQLYEESYMNDELTLIRELRNSKLSDNERYALRRGIAKSDGTLTEKGVRTFVQWLYNTQGEKFLTELQAAATKEEQRIEAIEDRKPLGAQG